MANIELKDVIISLLEEPTPANTADYLLMYDSSQGDLNKVKPSAMLGTELITISGLTPSNDDILQRKAGAWTNRTIAQLKTDLAITKADLGLSNVDNTSDATKNSANVSLTNKTINATLNTITDIGASEISADIITGLVAETTINNADLLMIYDASASALRYITRGNLVAGLLGSEPTVIVPIGIACSDESTAITTGTAKATFRMPFAFTLTGVRASVTTAPTGSTIIIDINEEGTSILSTKLSIDATEKTSTTATTAAVLSDTSLADDAEITIDFDQVGSTVAGTGVKVWLIGYKS